MTFGAEGKVNKYFIAPCSTRLRSQKEVVRFLDPNLKSVKYTKTKKLALPLNKIPFREELHPEDWKITTDINASTFANFTQTEKPENNDANLEETVKEKPEREKYFARNTSTMFCKDDPHPPQRNFESKRVLAFSPTEGEKSPKESWTYRPREPDSFLEEDLTLLSDTNETSNVSQESGVLTPSSIPLLHEVSYNVPEVYEVS